MLKKDISTWNREVFGKVEMQRTNPLNDLLALEQAAENRALSSAELSKLVALKTEIQNLALAEEILWRKKSRCPWLKEGDINTKYFQRIAYFNRRKKLH